MNALLLLPALAALVVWFAGRRDAARDPRLTTLALALLALSPLLLWLPKIPLLPAVEIPAGGPESASPAVWPQVMGVIWLAGFLFCLARLGLSAWGLARWKRKSVKAGVEDGVELRQLPGLRGPVAAGVLRKTIFVPEGWAEWDAETRRTVLLHELAHHRRRDPLVRWLAELAVAVHWFNPFVYWMRRRLMVQCEHACDQRVIAAGIRPDRYAEVLCRFASRRTPAVAGLAMADMSSLEARVRHLMIPHQTRGFFTLAALTATLVWATVIVPLIGRKAAALSDPNVPDAAEIEMRLSADPFPADRP